MQKKLNLYFTTADKKSYHITLNYPKDNLTKAEAEAVGQKIYNERRTLAEFKKASYVTTQQTVLQYFGRRRVWRKSHLFLLWIFLILLIL